MATHLFSVCECQLQGGGGGGGGEVVHLEALAKAEGSLKSLMLQLAWEVLTPD